MTTTDTTLGLRMGTDDDRLQRAIERLVAEARSGRGAEREIEALKELVGQLRDANQNLVLATMKAQVLQEEAEARNRQQNEFLAMLAHELRNPMAPISNAATLLEKIISSHPLLPQIQGAINRQVQHMARLLDDLLDASRIKSGKVTLRKEPISLAEVVNRSVEVSRPSMTARRQQFSCEPVCPSVRIEGDLVRLAQALSNLLLNASRYTQEDGSISLDVTLHADSVVVCVKDNGRGIEPELQRQIFDIFTQGPRSLERSEGGLGIGLAVAQGLARMHGGDITVKSDGPGMGSEFFLILPRLAADAAEAPARAGLAGLGSNFAACRILLIEDNPDALDTLKALLELAGHFVGAARDGVSGLAMANHAPFDFIVCDIGLPGMDGYEIITRLRSRPGQVRPVAIALSGYGQPEDRARALEAGFDHYLVKPVAAEQLMEVITTRQVA